jgi:hypothetical protein
MANTLELCGPMMMSYAAISHVQYRLTENGRGTRLSLTHRALGEIDPKHREVLSQGWGKIMEKIKERVRK